MSFQKNNNNMSFAWTLGELIWIHLMSSPEGVKEISLM